jgi:hypothetical protein
MVGSHEHRPAYLFEQAEQTRVRPQLSGRLMCHYSSPPVTPQVWRISFRNAYNELTPKSFGDQLLPLFSATFLCCECLMMRQLHGSSIEWHEADHELVLHLPSRVWRMIRTLLKITAFFAPFILGVAYASDGWLPAVIGMAAVPAILLCVAYAKMREAYLNDTRVTITPDRVILAAVQRGHETVKEFSLAPPSRAWQWCPRQATSRSPVAEPQGIVIADQTYDPEAGDDPNDQSKPRFGGNLTRGEMDWVEWQVNLFLDRNGHAAASQPNELEKPTSGHNGLVRIEPDGFEARIVFPNSKATGSYTGIGSLFFGVIFLTICCVPLIVIWGDADRMSLPQLLLQLVYVGVFGILGLAGTSNGLVQLFGRRQLTISPQRVQYSAGVFGIGVWWTLPTADIVSVWNPSKYVARRRPNKDIANAQGAVIRTARRQITLRAVHEAIRSGVRARWLADEISNRIVAARTQVGTQAAVV